MIFEYIEQVKSSKIVIDLRALEYKPATDFQRNDFLEDCLHIKGELS